MRRNFLIGLVLTIFFFGFIHLPATELVWTPINPSFGGSSFNAQWLMQQATDQNTFSEVEKPTMLERDPLQDFKDQLNRQILSRLASQLTGDIFGETELTPGHYEVGNYIIDISEGLDGVHITIVDQITGNETSIIVPYF